MFELTGSAEPRAGKGKPVSGDCIDITPYAAAVGFVYPVALDREAAGAIEAWIADDARTLRSWERRILEILLKAREAVHAAGEADSATFSLYRLTNKREREATKRIAVKIEFAVRCIPGDDDEPVIVIEYLAA